MKNNILVTLYLSISLVSCNIVSQKVSKNNDSKYVVDKVADEICNKLNSVKDINKLTESEAKIIVHNAYSKYSNEWDAELERVGNPNNPKNTKLDYLLCHRLQLNCSKFKIINNLLDKNCIENKDSREMYLKVKDFIISAESGIEVDSLKQYFADKNSPELQQKLKKLCADLQKYKQTSGIFITQAYSSLGFRAGIFDYITGDENYALIFVFNEDRNFLLDELVLRTKEELDAMMKQDSENESEDPEITPFTSSGLQ